MGCFDNHPHRRQQVPSDEIGVRLDVPCLPKALTVVDFFGELLVEKTLPKLDPCRCVTSWSFKYTGNSYVYSPEQIGRDCEVNHQL